MDEVEVIKEETEVPKTEAKFSKKALEQVLWRRGVLYWKMHSIQKEMYEIYHKADPRSTLVWLCSRQMGKCIASNTKVSTPNGVKYIQDIKVGDIVYGYNSYGVIEPTEVKQVHVQGVKKVVDLKHRNRVIASATMDHRWLVYDTYRKITCVKTTKEILDNPRLKIKREYFNLIGGDIHEPHAYTLGAMLGDGCCSIVNTNQLVISSENNKIPEKISKELDCFYWKLKSNNFNWVLSNEYQTGRGTRTSKFVINYYNEWCKGRKAHEKTCDYNIIRQWTRESQLQFLAGLIDTDGSIYTTGRNNNELKFSLSMQAKLVVECIKNLFLDLWQIELCENVDDRSKYKNGPCYTVYSNNNFCVKHFLKELSPYLVCERKQYKPDYENYPNYNHIPEYVGVIAGEEYEIETFDLGIDNGTHLYCLANGLVTHNSYMITLMTLEECLKTPNINVALITDTKLHLEGIFEPLFRDILLDCPEDVRPEYNKSKFTFYFKNGSQIHLAGTDAGHAEKLRGKKYKAIFIDEAGFCSNLDYIVKSILIPTLTHTNGKIVMATTPPENPEHEFIPFMEKAEVESKLTKKTIYDNPLITPEVVENIKKELGGEDSEGFRREYLCVDELTPIKTKNGMKYIKDIQVGDYVWTHKGRYKKVLNVFKNKLDNRKVYKIKCGNNEGFICTEGHKLLITKTNQVNKFDKKQTSWVEIQEIKHRPTERIYFNVPIDTTNNTTITPELAYLSGWFVAEGHTSKTQQQVILSLNKNDPIDEINRCSMMVFGKEFKLYTKVDGSLQYRLNSKKAKIYFDTFGRGANNKHLNNDIRLGDENVKINFLKGYFSGDGWINHSKHEVGVASVGYILLQEVSDLLNSIGIENSFKKIRSEGKSTILGRQVFIKNCYNINLTGKSYLKFLKKIHNQDINIEIKNQRHKIIDGILYSRITSIEQIEYNKEYVYDIEVEDDHSYCNSFATFHNCEVIRNVDSLVVPEFNDDAIKEIVVDVIKPGRFVPYIGMDLGYKDLTAVVFGYYNFDVDKLVIEDEIVLEGRHLILPEFTNSIMNKEKELFTLKLTNEFIKPIRVSDINHIVTQEMSRLSGYTLFFEPPKKDDIGTMINQFRTLIKNRKIIIHPRCVHTIAHIKNARWKNANLKIEFGRSEAYGHYDALAAAYYMARRVEWSKNPYPQGFQGDRANTFFYNPEPKAISNNAEVFRKVFFKRK